MPIVIGGGVEIGGGITVERGFATSVTLVYDLDAANYSAVPVNGTKDATGTYTLSDVQGLYTQYKSRFGY